MNKVELVVRMRAERRLEAESRATPPKQILQMIVGRTQFVNLRSFAPVDLKAIAAAHNGVTGMDVAVAGGAVVKASGKPRRRPLACRPSLSPPTFSIPVEWAGVGTTPRTSEHGAEYDGDVLT